MRFTRLRLNGFKSFVDPTDLLIQDGLTGVVGPNGCGKSNLLEALRWVMGENRPTAMRGSGMEDVVFAGTGSRPARAFAEVALTLDNSDRRAPAGFNDSDQIEVTRRLTRDAGSAYRLNGKELRARDVQMLFADASTGAHSPALVRQGQISELINARPRARRRVLEEAAGISGLYQRRHEAELRLSATEANLARVGDTVEALSAQLATLARQARQAARYREIGADLRRAEGQLLCRRHQDAQAQALERAAALTRAATTAATAEREARAAAEARAQAEQALPPLREEETIAAAILQRLLVERETLTADGARAQRVIDDLTARGAQLRRDAERESALSADAGDSMARLAEERAALMAAGEGHEGKLAAAAGEATQAQAALQALETQLATETEALAQLVAREKALTQQVEEARARQRRTRDAEARARADAEREAQRLTSARQAWKQTLQAQEAAQADLAQAEQALTGSEAALTQARQAEDAARQTRAEAEGTSSTLAAEARALARLLQQSTPTGAPVLDQLRVAPGMERALGAALGDDLQAPLSDGGGSGWQALPALDPAPPLPGDAPALSAQVQGPGALARRLSQVGLVDAARGAALHAALAPGQRLVTAEGDLWRWDGLVRRGADGAADAGVLRLQQKNRLEALQAALEEAQAATDAAVAAHEQAAAALGQAQAADRTAREARRAAEARSSEVTRRAARAEAEAMQAESRGVTAQAQAERLAGDVQAADRRLAEAERALAAVDDLAAARAALDGLRGQVEAARARLLTCRSTAETLRRDGEARARRLADIDREEAGWQQRAASAAERVADLETRAAQAEAELAQARDAPARIADQAAALAGQVTAAEGRRTAAIEALSTAEAALRTAQGAERETERAAGAAREARAVAQAHADAADEAARLAEEEITAAHDCSAAALMDRLGIATADLPALSALEPEIARLKRARDALGAVNLRAEEDARELSAEHDTLIAERADLEAAVAKLRGGIGALNREGRERLLAAFDQVNGNFATLFTHLFGGGEARLVLVESDDPLEAGLEIMCQPPGKKLSTLSLLSGGEQTLTAMALIFGVFLANPAPICVLDEVDAPLDDANVTRFCNLLDEMTRRTETRFLIITHNAISMARMDRLFGVTMAEQGVSQLVSVDLKRAETMVA